MDGVVHGPSKLRYYCINIIQEDDYTVSIHADDIIQSIKSYPISRIRHKQCDEKMNELEFKSFLSINASVGWLGITESPLRSFCYSYLKQKMGVCRVSAISSQISALRILKKYGISTKHIQNNIGTVINITLIVFSDGNHTKDASRLFYIVGLVIDTVKMGNQFHVLSWASHRSIRPETSTLLLLKYR